MVLLHPLLHRVSSILSGKFQGDSLGQTAAGLKAIADTHHLPLLPIQDSPHPQVALPLVRVNLIHENFESLATIPLSGYGCWMFPLPSELGLGLGYQEFSYCITCEKDPFPSGPLK